MELEPLFRVGETVMIVKPENPAILWNESGGMDHLIGQLRTVLEAGVIDKVVRYRVSNDGRSCGQWAFSEDCLREPDGSIRERKEPEPTYDDQGRETVRN